MRKKIQPEAALDRGIPAIEGAALLGMSRSSFWKQAAKREDFPKPARYGSRCTRWNRAELLAWREAQK